MNMFTDKYYSFSEKVEFDDDRDQRWDCGLVAGVGLEYRFANRWAAQVEARYYHSTTMKDYRYNSTIAIQAGVNYKF